MSIEKEVVVENLNRRAGIDIVSWFLLDSREKVSGIAQQVAKEHHCPFRDLIIKNNCRQILFQNQTWYKSYS